MICSATAAKVQGYIDAIRTNDIVACALLKAAVERHLQDLERQRTPDFPYYFNATHAEACCDFFPLVLKHSIGEFAGMPFDLEPFQAFGFWVLFGWKRECDDSRRFRKFFKSYARKNGKSTEASGMALLLAAMDVNPVTQEPESVAEIILAATKKEQVEKVVYAEVERMRKRSPSIEQASTGINRQITFKHNSGSIRCVGSDKPYDGLNPHAVILDELHAWREYHRKFYDTMQTGSGSRVQPLIGSITTAGDDQSHLWNEEYTYAKGVLEGHIKDESLFCLIFELDENDDPLDESVWIKANPNLGVSVKRDYLRDQATKAAASAINLNRFTRYHGNRRVTSTEKAFDMVLWDAAAGDLSDWKQADAICGGFDLGSRDDLAAYAVVARFDTQEDKDGKPLYRYEVRTKSYIAQNTQRDLTKAPFAQWVYDDLLQVEKYPINALKADFLHECETWGIETVAYDPYTAQQMADDLAQEGITAARMAQTQRMFNEPIQDLLQALIDGRLGHDGDALLRWCVSNAMIDRNKQDQWMYDKAAAEEKIDPVVAMTMAYRMACLAPARVRGKLYL